MFRSIVLLLSVLAVLAAASRKSEKSDKQFEFQIGVLILISIIQLLSQTDVLLVALMPIQGLHHGKCPSVTASIYTSVVAPLSTHVGS